MQRFNNGDIVTGTDPLTLKEWTGKVITRLDGKQVVLNESRTWKYVTDLYGLRLLDEADMSQQPINSFNDYVNNKIGNAIDNGSNFEKIKPEDMKKLSKSFFDATRKNHDIKDHPHTEDEAQKITQNAIATKTLEKQNGDDQAAKEAEKNISEIEAKLKEKVLRELNPRARKLFESVLNESKPAGKFTSSYFGKLRWDLSGATWDDDKIPEELSSLSDASRFVQNLFGDAEDYLNTNHKAYSNKRDKRSSIVEWFEDPNEYYSDEYLDENGEPLNDEFTKEATPEVIEAIKNNNLKDFCKETLISSKDFLKPLDINKYIEAIDYIYENIYSHIKNNEMDKVTKYRTKKAAEDEEQRKIWAEEAAKRDKESQFLKDAAKKAKVEFYEPNSFGFEFTKKDDWMVVLNTEDEDDAERFRNEVGDLLEGTENAYGASYDDIPGMGDIHLGCMPYYEWSEICGGDTYDDLDEDVREKYVVFGCPAKKWIEWRRQNDW